MFKVRNFLVPWFQWDLIVISVLRTVQVYSVILWWIYLENRYKVQISEPQIVIELFATSLLIYFLALISQLWRSIAGMEVVDCLVLSFVIIIINTINFSVTLERIIISLQRGFCLSSSQDFDNFCIGRYCIWQLLTRLKRQRMALNFDLRIFFFNKRWLRVLQCSSTAWRGTFLFTQAVFKAGCRFC